MNRLLCSLLLVFSTYSFAEITYQEHGIPQDKHLGMRIALPLDNTNTQYLDNNKIKLNKPNFLSLNKQYMDLRVVKDKQTNINHLVLIADYDLKPGYSQKPSETQQFKREAFLYLQCPVSKEVSRYQVTTNSKGEKEVKLLDYHTEKTLSEGFYKFISSSDNTKFLIDSSIGLEGKPKDLMATEELCSIAELSYSLHEYYETTRPFLLKEIGITE